MKFNEKQFEKEVSYLIKAVLDDKPRFSNPISKYFWHKRWINMQKDYTHPFKGMYSFDNATLLKEALVRIGGFYK